MLPYCLKSSTARQDAFLRRYDFSGNEIWTRQIGSGSVTVVFGIASAGYGAVCVVGMTAGVLPGETSSGDIDAWVRFYDENEGLLWSDQFGTSGTDACSGVTVFNGAAYVVGGVAGALPGQTHAGGQDVFVRRYESSNGTEMWTQQFGGAGGDVAAGVAANALGVFVTGVTDAGIPGQIFLGGPNDGILRACEHTTGDELWTREFGTADFDNPRDVIASPTGVIVVGEVATALPGQSNTACGGE